MPKHLDKHTRRGIRILNALINQTLDEAWVADPQFQEDLEAEVAHFERRKYGGVGGGLVRREQLDALKERVREDLERRRAELTYGGKKGEPGPDESPESAPRVRETAGRTVLIIPGGWATQLFDIANPRHPAQIWLRPAVLMFRFGDLPLAAYQGYDVEYDLYYPTVEIGKGRAFPWLYNSLCQQLSQAGWDPVPFPYDWRKDMDHHDVTGDLVTKIKETYESTGDPVHIITHSQGGTVTRNALTRLIQNEADVDNMVGKVIMLGPANFGAFVSALCVAGSLHRVPMAKRFFHRPKAKSQRVTKTFTALYQLMPWDPNLVVLSGANDIRQSSFWHGLTTDIGTIDRDRHDRAFPAPDQAWGEQIDTEDLKRHITLILGHDSEGTPGGVEFDGDGVLDIREDATCPLLPGDGWVPDKLSILDSSNAYRTYKADHVYLPTEQEVIDAIRDLLNDRTPALELAHQAQP